MKKKKNQFLFWRDPATEKSLPAGVAFYDDEYGEFYLKIDEEPPERQYYLKPYVMSDKLVRYRMELVLKNKAGKFLKRQRVGEGRKDETTGGNIFIDYGSKYKTLVLELDVA